MLAQFLRLRRRPRRVRSKFGNWLLACQRKAPLAGSLPEKDGFAGRHDQGAAGSISQHLPPELRILCLPNIRQVILQRLSDKNLCDSMREKCSVQNGLICICSASP